MLVGLVLGLAIYNAVLLDFPLPLALYRKLIGQSCTLRDLQDMEPTLGKGLNALLQHEGQCAACNHCKSTVLTLPGPGCHLSTDSSEDLEELLALWKLSACTELLSACVVCGSITSDMGVAAPGC